MFDLDMYCTVILVVTVALAGLTGAKIPYFLGAKWRRDETERNWFMVGGGVASAVILAYISVPAMTFGSYLYGLVVLAAAVPAVGFMWAFVLGMLLVFERVITGLLNRLDATEKPSSAS